MNREPNDLTEVVSELSERFHTPLNPLQRELHGTNWTRNPAPTELVSAEKDAVPGLAQELKVKGELENPDLVGPYLLTIPNHRGDSNKRSRVPLKNEQRRERPHPRRRFHHPAEPPTKSLELEIRNTVNFRTVRDARQGPRRENTPTVPLPQDTLQPLETFDPLLENLTPSSLLAASSSLTPRPACSIVDA